MKAKLFTSAMFEKAWESELNKFLANENIRVVDVKFNANAIVGPGPDIEFYCALVLYEDKQ
jgi:hypothetical protein